MAGGKGSMKYDLTKTEALTAMREGNKVSREYFGPDEYIYIDDIGHIRSEEGFPFENWWANIEPTIGKTSQKCWSIKS